MKICVVVGHVWATKKEPSLNGLKFMVVKDDKSGEEFAAADMVGAGIGEKVLIVNGSTARRAVGAD
ncbi:MAG: ethanolamine utilization protein EutN, partial [Clostridia bacterium]|nr:ethanolamine utilization protein EutN [Clostridia bacterium]